MFLGTREPTEIIWWVIIIIIVIIILLLYTSHKKFAENYSLETSDNIIQKG